MLLPERISLLNRALRHKRHTVVVLRASLPDSMPVNGHLHTFHMVLYIDNYLVILAHLDGRSRQHSVGCEDSSLDTIGQHTLTMRPHHIRRIWCTDLTRSVIYNMCFNVK